MSLTPSSAAPRLWIVPPHRDPTLVPRDVPGWRVLDLQARFWERLVSAAAVAAASRVHLAELAPGSSPQRAVELTAAAIVLGRPQAGTHARLRAQRAALAALTRDAPVRLTLDDVELAQGTTERSADVASVAGRADLPWEEELQVALHESRHAPEVRLVVDCDQRLPFAFAFLQRLEAAIPVSWCGRFAVRHQQALADALGDGRVQFSEAVPPLDVVLEDGPATWVWDGAAIPAERWAGYLPLAASAAPDRRCAAAVLPFAAFDGERILSVEGEWHKLGDLVTSERRPPTVGEWHFGAPGVGEALARRTAEALGALPFCDWVAGLRRFHWSRQAPIPAAFGGEPVAVAPPDRSGESPRDLARSVTLQSPATADAAALESLVERTIATLCASGRPPAAGRVALALARPPPAPAAAPAELRLAEDAAVVDVPVAMDGRPQRTLLAISLRTGAQLALDARLAPMLERLSRAAPAAEAFAGIPPPQRERIVGALAQRCILEAVVR